MNDNNDEPRFAELIEPTALEAQVRAEIDTQIATAHRFPRSIKTFQKKAEGMATITVEVAASCEYKLPRGKEKDGSDKIIKGPSIRMAEIVAACYGNLRIGARITEEGKSHITVQGIAHDLETNVAYSSEIRRRITTKDGRRYGEDMIAQTCNAACSIAQRNAIFKAVPLSLAMPVIEAARATALGDLKTLPERREKMLARFETIGVKRDRIFLALGVKGVEDLTLDLVADLHASWTSIEDRESTADELFPDPRAAAHLQKDAPKTTPAATEQKANTTTPAPNEGRP